MGNFARSPILDFWQGSEYACWYVTPAQKFLVLFSVLEKYKQCSWIWNLMNYMLFWQNLAVRGLQIGKNHKTKYIWLHKLLLWRHHLNFWRHHTQLILLLKWSTFPININFGSRIKTSFVLCVRDLTKNSEVKEKPCLIFDYYQENGLSIFEMIVPNG